MNQKDSYIIIPEDEITQSGIKSFLGSYENVFSLDVYDQIPSTNSFLMESADDFPSWHTVISNFQTAGRGRTGKSFFSPSGTGLYLSILLRPHLPMERAIKITCAAAVAVCQAIEDCTDLTPQIKWVNDVFINGKKVCGILTESSINMETDGLDWVVMGLGLNIYTPKNGFPKEIAQSAGALTTTWTKGLRNRIAASIMEHFYVLCKDLSSPTITEEYKKRSFLLDHQILVEKDKKILTATAIDINDSCQLVVRYPDGIEEILSSGEVHIMPAEIHQ